MKQFGFGLALGGGLAGMGDKKNANNGISLLATEDAERRIIATEVTEDTETTERDDDQNLLQRTRRNAENGDDEK